MRSGAGGTLRRVVSAIAELRDIELAAVEAAVGQTSYSRGRGYARTRVLDVDWDADADTLVGFGRRTGRAL